MIGNTMYESVLELLKGMLTPKGSGTPGVFLSLKVIERIVKELEKIPKLLPAGCFIPFCGSTQCNDAINTAYQSGIAKEKQTSDALARRLKFEVEPITFVNCVAYHNTNGCTCWFCEHKRDHPARSCHCAECKTHA